MPTDKLMTIAEVAEYLGLATHTIYQWRYRGEGPPGLRLGRGQVRYRESAITAWLEEQRDRSPHAAA